MSVSSWVSSWIANSQLGLYVGLASGGRVGRERGVVLLSAVARENGRDEDDDEKLGGSTRVNPAEPVLWRLRNPMRFRVGERPAGVERAGWEEVWMRAGDLGVNVVRVVGEVGLNSSGDLVRMKAEGLEVEDSLPLERLVERMGSMFSASISSS